MVYIALVAPLFYKQWSKRNAYDKHDRSEYDRKEQIRAVLGKLGHSEAVCHGHKAQSGAEYPRLKLGERFTAIRGQDASLDQRKADRHKYKEHYYG